MQILVSPTQLDLPPGTVIRVPATWQEYQTLAAQRGDGSVPRMKYCNGELFLMVPFPEHGKDASLLADLVKILLDAQALEYDSFTPITITLPESGGIEPDFCFYIESLDRVRGKKRINWQVDPPPDLVLEIDVTNYSDVDDYLPYQVPEVWMLKNGKLNVYTLNEDGYCLTQISPYFPDLQLQLTVDQYRQVAYEQSSSQAMRQLWQQFPG